MTIAEHTDWNDIPALHWQGGELDCARCEHAALRAAGGCEPGRQCMQDVYARRIDRFFRTHPELANQHLAHAYFEVRAIAARYADVFRLPSLMDDPDETVRLQLALRLPQRQLMRMREDPHREVRIRVAQCLAVDQVASMLHDEDYHVRATVARRLPEALLPQMISDPDLMVRREVARRVQMPALWRMTTDREAEVRRIVAERLPAPLLDAFIDDADLLVRWEVAARALPPLLERLTRDPESEIRERASARLTQLQRKTAPEPEHG
ncbi:MAG: 4Fe4S-binding leucine-rich repeat protein [Burkholderiaceae bacterium]|nr:4Fe4S-binding leucine-rich repeat protein [Burkholderiaceae bacterium]